MRGDGRIDYRASMSAHDGWDVEKSVGGKRLRG